MYEEGLAYAASIRFSLTRQIFCQHGCTACSEDGENVRAEDLGACAFRGRDCDISESPFLATATRVCSMVSLYDTQRQSRSHTYTRTQIWRLLFMHGDLIHSPPPWPRVHPWFLYTESS